MSPELSSNDVRKSWDNPEFGVPLMEETSVTMLTQVNNNIFGGIGGGEGSTWRTNMRSGVFGGNDIENSRTSLKYQEVDEYDDEFIEEKLACFARELSEKAPIV